VTPTRFESPRRQCALSSATTPLLQKELINLFAAEGIFFEENGGFFFDKPSRQIDEVNE
jgi:hypothetical protein